MLAQMHLFVIFFETNEKKTPTSNWQFISALLIPVSHSKRAFVLLTVRVGVV